MAPTPRRTSVDVVASCLAGDRHVLAYSATACRLRSSSTTAAPSSTTGPSKTCGAATCSRRRTRHPWPAVPSSTSRSPSTTPRWPRRQGYHVANIGIHVLCATGAVRPGWRTYQLSGERGASPSPCSGRVHPLNSEAVNYVTQRTESLMALFYLLTLYCARRALRRGCGATDGGKRPPSRRARSAWRARNRW